MRHLYSALLCIAVHPKRFTIMWGGLYSSTTSVQHPLGWCDGCHRTTTPVRSPHTSYRWRESHRANQVYGGLLGGHDWQGPVEGILPGHRGYAPTLYEKCHGTFNDHRESGSRFNVLSKRQSFLTVQCPHHNTGVLGPTQTTDVTFIVKSNLKAYWMQFLKHLLHGLKKMGY